MQFVVTALDFPEALERRLEIRPKHLELIERLRQEKRCLYAARLLNEDGSGTSIGSVMIFDYESANALNAMLQDEPYVVNRVWEKIEIRPCEVAPKFLIPSTSDE